MAELTLERDTTVPGLAWITFTRPEAKNALSNVGWRELSDALDAVDGDRSLGVVAIRGTGDAFSAGADLDYIDRLRDSGESVLPLLRLVAQTVVKVIHLSKLVICAIDGACYGGGVQLALCADINIATTRTTFMASAGGRFGIPSAQFGQLLLPLVVGLKRAKTLSYLPQVLSASRCLEWGIFDEVVESDELTEHVQDTGQRLLKQGLTNLAIAKSGITKSVVNQVVGGLEQALMLAVYAQAQVIDQQGTTWRQKGAVDPKAAG